MSRIILGPVDERLFDCWFGGLTIRATMRSIRRALGVELGFEHIRVRFVLFSEQWGRA